MPRATIAVLALLLFTSLAQTQDNPLGMVRSPHISPVVIDRRLPATLPALSSQGPLLRLQSLATDERRNAELHMCVPSGLPAAFSARAKAIEAEWNMGNYDGALAAYEHLVTSQDAGRIEAAIDWRTPVPRSLDRVTAGDVQLGVSDTITAVDVVCDSSNLQLFAVIAYGTSVAPGYDVLRSTDGGGTWAVTGTLSSGVALTSGKSITIAYVAGKLRVFYILSGGGELRWRQYDGTGTAVTFANGQYMITLAGPGASPTVVEAKAFSNNLYLNNRLYYATILSDHTAHLYWALPDSTYFTPFGTTGHAVGGLSAVWTAYGSYTSGYCVSYVDTAGYFCIDSATGGGAWGTRRRVLGNESSALGFYKDTLICVHDVSGPPVCCRYEISYDKGRTWSTAPVDTQSVTHDLPSVCVEKGQGMAIIYRYYTPIRQERIITRRYQGPGLWTSPVVFAGHEPYPVSSGITALGGDSWGVVYVSWSAPYRAYFDKVTKTAVSVDPVADRLPGTIALYQNYPNPFNPSTTIRFELPSAMDVRLGVYDILGREVSSLINGRMAVGLHEATFDASRLASGVYFYRLQAGNTAKTMKLTVLK